MVTNKARLTFPVAIEPIDIPWPPVHTLFSKRMLLPELIATLSFWWVNVFATNCDIDLPVVLVENSASANGQLKSMISFVTFVAMVIHTSLAETSKPSVFFPRAAPSALSTRTLVNDDVADVPIVGSVKNTRYAVSMTDLPTEIACAGESLTMKSVKVPEPSNL